MELACLEHSIPIRSVSAKGFGNTIAEFYHAVGIVQSKYNSNYMDQRLASSNPHYILRTQDFAIDLHDQSYPDYQTHRSAGP